MAAPQYRHASVVVITVDGQNLYLVTGEQTESAGKVDTTNTLSPRDSDGRLQKEHIYDPLENTMSFDTVINVDDAHNLKAGLFYPGTFTDGSVTKAGTVGIDSVSRSGGSTGFEHFRGTLTWTGAVS